MLLYSTIWRALFWVFMGLLYALMIASAPIWARDLGMEMNWWKWLLSGLWYGLLSIGIAMGFTLMGEKEPRAGQYTLAITLVSMFLLGLGLWYLL
ncbi:MAG: hypothetical protein JRJ29_16540 [Deltaproteobacteria bacterium]|nr:hypothetical protein [Deltaproteobacteria bacterium]